MNPQDPTPTQQPQANAPQPMKISITLPTNAYFVSGIRDFTLGLIRNMTDFNEQWAFRFQSVVDELCNNAIEHGSKPGEEITITFLNYAHESIEITVEDSGTGPDKMSVDDLRQLVKERTTPGYIHSGIRGRGLSKIVSEWTDELNFEKSTKGGTAVHIKKRLNDQKIQQQPAGQNANLLEQPAPVML